jgi:hypothetical protein
MSRLIAAFRTPPPRDGGLHLSLGEFTILAVLCGTILVATLRF